MTSTKPPSLFTTDLPVDAVLFAPAVVVDPPAPEPGVASRPTPGVRRLVDALTR